MHREDGEIFARLIEKSRRRRMRDSAWLLKGKNEKDKREKKG